MRLLGDDRDEGYLVPVNADIPDMVVLFVGDPDRFTQEDAVTPAAAPRTRAQATGGGSSGATVLVAAVSTIDIVSRESS